MDLDRHLAVTLSLSLSSHSFIHAVAVIDNNPWQVARTTMWHSTVLVGRRHAAAASSAMGNLKNGLLHSSYKRCIHASHKTHQAAAAAKRTNKDLFTPSPFKRSDKININNKFRVQRDLREGDNAYGIRRYLLLPRDNDDDEDPTKKPTIIASINANKNMLFGAQLHTKQVNGTDENYIADYFAACEPLLDLAKEDASINGQQVQALATLKGLCSWVKECLDRDGEESEVLTALLHGEQPNLLQGNESEEQEMTRQKIKSHSAKIILNNESDRILALDAVRAIATGIPRPGHSVVGAGTYRDGKDGWTSLAWEYSNIATVPFNSSSTGVTGLEEVSLYKSRDGEVASIEHLASVEADYLKVAGGAMARMFFV